MSKIIQALEKAKRDGTLHETAGTVEERETMAPVGTEAERAAERGPPRSSELALREALSPDVLRGVDLHLDALHKPMSIASEQYRALRNRLERVSLERNVRTVAVTSASKGEGKSLTAVNLAAVMALDVTKRILLVDADLRRPNVHRLLGMTATPGLCEHLLGSAGDDEVLRSTPFFGLTVVTAGSAQGHPAELLASPDLSRFMGRCRSTFDFVIVDTPPLYPVSDVPFLTDSLDGVLVVVRANRTNRALLRQAVEALPPEKVLGTILNRAERLTDRFGYGYGYGSGYGYGYGKTY